MIVIHAELTRHQVCLSLYHHCEGSSGCGLPYFKREDCDDGVARWQLLEKFVMTPKLPVVDIVEDTLKRCDGGEGTIGEVRGRA